VLADLEENEDGSPVEKEPEVEPAPSPSQKDNSPDVTRVYTPEVPAEPPAVAETSQAALQAGVMPGPAWGQGPNSQGFTGREGESRNQVTVSLLQQYFSVVLGTLVHLDHEIRDPRYGAHRAEQWRRRHELESTLAAVGQQLQWYSAMEQAPLAQYCALARHMYPSGYAGVQVVGSQSGVGSGTPPAVPGANFAGFGAHSGYQFGAPVNSARK
jgi:hypothetical protein